LYLDRNESNASNGQTRGAERECDAVSLDAWDAAMLRRRRVYLSDKMITIATKEY
jgi:hypothetical protein